MKIPETRSLFVGVLGLIALLALAAALYLTGPTSRPGAGPNEAGAGVARAEGDPSVSGSAGGGAVAAAGSVSSSSAPAGVASPSSIASTASSMTAPSRSVTASRTARLGPPRGAPVNASRQRSAPAVSAALPLEPPPVPVAEILQGVDLSDPQQRALAVARMKALGQARRDEVQARALALGLPFRRETAAGAVTEIYGFRGDQPVYRKTMNVNAAISSAANLIRDFAPYTVAGAGVKAGVWDSGWVRSTHQEFAARVTPQDADAVISAHATHVGGTIAATGVDPRAKGMAPSVKIDSYDWTDDYAEMTDAGAAGGGDVNRLPLSNHSYGYGWEDPEPYEPWLGRYEDEARATDAIAAKLPFYLIFWAAGNDQEFLDGYYGGYQSITFNGLAKNIITVGAVEDAVTSGRRDVNRATMSYFSSWGPCDDGRIKPDLVANGVGLISSVSSSDSAYANASGTSMATPSATGSAALLVELFQREFGGQLPPASLVKALLIHTADDLGTAGPDYRFGWGLINVQAAADLLLAHKAETRHPRLYQGALSNAEKTRSHTFTWDGVTPLKATLSWIDQPGQVQNSPDSRTPNLVHNLDLRITAPDGTTVFQPFVMPFVGTWTTASMALPAVKGDNNTDTVEQISAGLPGQLGTYTMTVTVDGALATAAQDYSIVLTGAGDPVNPPPVVKILSPDDGARLSPELPVTLTVEAADVTAEQTPGVVSSIELFVNGTLFATRASSPAEFEFMPPAAGTYVFEARAADSQGEIGTDSISLTFAYPPPGSVREDFMPPAADDHVQALAADPQGRIYVGGRFTKLDGGSAPRIGRLRPDGSVDPSFFVGAGPDAQVRALLHVPQDKGLYVGGHFANVAGTARRALARLRTGQTGFADGSLDPVFAPSFEGANPSTTPHVVALARQSDGKILVGGFFAKVNGVNRSNLARLQADGTLDLSFAPNPGGTVNCIALQADGKILIGGSFTSVAGQTSRRIARLNRDGTLDTTFVTGTSTTSGGFDGPVHSIAVTLDGEVIAGGSFNSYNGRSFYSNMAKLLPNGVVDGKFNFTPGVNGVVNDLHLRPGGEILVSGLFTTVGNNVLGLAATNVGRICQINSAGPANGMLDAGFNFGGTGADGSVLDSITLPDGDILLGGAFTTFNGEPRARLAVIAGFEKSTPIIVSQLFHNIDAGVDLEFAFRASGDDSYSYQLIGPPLRGVTFDERTGALRGLPLDAGRYDLQVVATSSRGSTQATRFVLNVNDKKVPYAQWKKAWFSEAEQSDQSVSGEHAVRNSTGMSNYLVYALGGGDPDAADASLLPVVQREKIGTKHYLTLTAPKYRGAEAAYRVECSSDLANWGWSNPADVVTISDGATQLKARAAVPATEIGKQFLRLKVLAP